jgi:hypothetical protein
MIFPPEVRFAVRDLITGYGRWFPVKPPQVESGPSVRLEAGSFSGPKVIRFPSAVLLYLPGFIVSLG